METFIQFLEMDQDMADRYIYMSNHDNLPFSDVFGNKLRIVVPMNLSPNFKYIEKILGLVGYQVHWDANEAEKSKETQKGKKIVKTSISKAIRNASKSLQLEEIKLKNLIDWVTALYSFHIPKSSWQKEQIKRQHYFKISKQSESAKSGKNYAIVISRHPLDVVRMSDFNPGKTVPKDAEDITSCHSPGDSYFQSAEMEARYGGPVAYLVDANELKKHSDNLQTSNLFHDDERDIEGIKPIARNRIKRFTSKDKKIDIMLPDTTLYGRRNLGLRDEVLKWVKETQSEKIKKIKKYGLTINDFKMRGGWYRDHGNDSQLWDKVMETHSEPSSTEYGFEEKQDSDYRDSNHEDIVREEMLEFHNQYNREGGEFTKYPLVKTEYTIEDGGYDGMDVNMGWKAEIKFILPVERISSQIHQWIRNFKRDNPLDLIQMALDDLPEEDFIKFIKSQGIEDVKVEKIHIKIIKSSGKLDKIEIILEAWDNNFERHNNIYAHGYEDLNTDSYDNFMADVKMTFDSDYEKVQSLINMWLSNQILKLEYPKLGKTVEIGRVLDKPWGEKLSRAFIDRSDRMDHDDKINKRTFRYLSVESESNPEEQGYGMWRANKTLHFNYDDLPLDVDVEAISNKFRLNGSINNPVFKPIKDLVYQTLSPFTKQPSLFENIYKETRDALPYLEIKIYPDKGHTHSHHPEEGKYISSPSLSVFLLISFEIDGSTPRKIAQRLYQNAIKFDLRYPEFQKKVNIVFWNIIKKAIEETKGTSWHQGWEKIRTVSPMFYHPEKHTPLFPYLNPYMNKQNRSPHMSPLSPYYTHKDDPLNPEEKGELPYR